MKDAKLRLIEPQKKMNEVIGHEEEEMLEINEDDKRNPNQIIFSDRYHLKNVEFIRKKTLTKKMTKNLSTL